MPQQGAFALTSRAVELLWAALAAAGEGVCALAGGALSLAAQWGFVVMPGMVTLTGPETGLVRGNIWTGEADGMAPWSPVAGAGDAWAPRWPDQTDWIIQ